MFERFAAPARRAVTLATEEALRRGDRRVGTDHLLIGLLDDASTAQTLGITAEAACATATELDARALRAIGLEPGDLGRLDPAAGGRRLPFAPAPKAVLARAVALAAAGRSRRIEPAHLLRALLERASPDPAADLLAALGVDRERALARLDSAA